MVSGISIQNKLELELSGRQGEFCKLQ